jgi:hypothetical protein
VRVAGVVQPHAPDAGQLDEALEAAVDVRGVDRPARVACPDVESRKAVSIHESPPLFGTRSPSVQSPYAKPLTRK